MASVVAMSAIGRVPATLNTLAASVSALSTSVYAASPLDGVDLTKPCKIGFSQGTMNHPWRVAMVEGNKSWADANLPAEQLPDRHAQRLSLDVPQSLFDA